MSQSKETEFPLLPASTGGVSQDAMELSPHDSGHSPKAPDEEKRVYGRDLNNSDWFYRGKDNEVLFELIEAQYGICFTPETSFASTFSSTSRKAILTEVGTGKKFFLKEKPFYCLSTEALATSADFQDYLADSTGLVPKPIQTKVGSYYLQIGDRFFFLTEFVEGRLFDGSFQAIESAARALAQIHVKSFEFSLKDSYLRKSSLSDAFLFVQMAGSLEAAQEDKWRVALIEKLQKTLMINAQNDVSTQVPNILNQGDFAPFNLVFNGTSVVAVNDFDNAAVFPRVRDIADGLITFCDGVNYAGATSSFRRPVSSKFNVRKAKVFLRSYLEMAPALTTQEMTQLELEIKNRWIELMALGIVRGDFAYFDVTEAFTYLDFLSANYEKILIEAII